MERLRDGFVGINRRQALHRTLHTMFGIAAAAAAMPSGAAAGSKLALVIGNGAYKFGALRKPVDDARAVAARLEELDFEVDRLEDVKRRPLIQSLADFSAKARTRSVRLVYYAGHGIQWRGRNYMVPVDSSILSEDDIDTNCADLGEFVERLTAIRNGTNIVILDACRANPFAGGVFVTPEGRPLRFRDTWARAPEGSRRIDTPMGLEKVDTPAGTLIAYSAAPGQVAFEGSTGDHSPYAKHLLAHIGTPGVPIEQMLKRVRVAVAQETAQRQIPWDSSSLMANFCFRPDLAGRCGV